MKKNKTFYLSLGIAFALFNVIAFVIPAQRSSCFWISYAFSTVAFAVQIPLWKIAFDKKDTLKSKFLGIPVVYVGLVYLIIQLIAFAVFMLVPIFPTGSAIIVCAIILAVSALCAIGGQAGGDEIARVENKVKEKRAFIQFLQVDIETLAQKQTDTETKRMLKKLAEKIRFSDPMSSESLAESESRINTKAEELKTSENMKPLISELDALLTERNKKCKILK